MYERQKYTPTAFLENGLVIVMKTDSVSKIKGDLTKLADRSFISHEAIDQIDQNHRTAGQISAKAQAVRSRVNGTQLNADEISRFRNQGRK